MTLSYKEVAEIVKIIDASSCEEVVLETEGTRLVVRRGSGADINAAPSPNQTNLPPAAREQAVQNTAPKAVTTPVANADVVADGVKISSPMVGTFYTRPSPDDAPFVEVGARVSAGDPMCMIEVMKLYTTIEASVSGVVTAILPEDGKLVEFDQPLFIIRAD
jgi:acetyl-CoA carboxylase biotin carboxyl carrier protein